MKRVALSLFVFGAFFCGPAIAQEGEQLARVQNRTVDFLGWDRAWRLDAQGMIVSNRRMIGKTEGTSLTFGGSSTSELSYFHPRHEWTNELRFELQYNRDPSLKRFNKSLDELRLDSFYIYKFENFEWVGPFSRFQFETSILKNEDLQTENKTYVITRRSGTSSKTQRSLKLTSPFSPMTFRESAGVYFRPIRENFFDLLVLAGGSARQTRANGQLSVKNIASTPEIEVVELRNIYQIGSEFSARLKGSLRENRLSYLTSAAILTPWVNNSAESEKRSALRLSVLEFKAQTAYAFADWIRLQYAFSALRDPQLVSGFQIQHDAQLVLGFNVFTRRRE